MAEEEIVLSPAYSYPQEEETAPVALADIPQGAGSRLDSDTVDGLQAVRAAQAGPNKLVATDANGDLPASVIPASAVPITVTTAAVTTSTLSFTGLTATSTYRLTGTYRQITSNGIALIRFNSDSGAGLYKWAVNYHSDAAAGGNEGSTGDTEIQMTGTSSVGAGLAATLMFTFGADPGDTTRVLVRGTIGYRTATPETYTAEFGGYYDGASALTSVQVLPSAGTITGNFILEKLN